MEGRKGIACLVGIVLFASGCAPYSRTSTSAVPPATTSAPGQAQRLDALLTYAERSRTLDADGLASEYAAATRVPRARLTPDARIRLAILLSHPRAPFRDDAAARGLLRRAAVEAGPQSADVSRFARLLHAAIGERVALEGAIAEERRRRLALQKELGELREKLEQLKTIEQEIDRRTPAPVVPERQ